MVKDNNVNLKTADELEHILEDYYPNALLGDSLKNLINTDFKEHPELIGIIRMEFAKNLEIPAWYQIAVLYPVTEELVRKTLYRMSVDEVKSKQEELILLLNMKGF